MIDSSVINKILDCPVGNGRWLERLAALSPNEIVGTDVSPAMLEAARARAAECNLKVELLEGVAESLPFDDGLFDLVFCHALAKHLPKQVQRTALLELSRVARHYVVCSFVVRKGIGGVIGRLRRAGGAVVVTEIEIVQWAAEAGLRLLSSESSTTPVGLERSYLFARP
jgi:ubiquinone/menaquinone biosynthesis C-methylase UbiE